MQQLDIFDHSADLMLRNDVLHALERRDAAASRQAWQRLQAEYGDDIALADLQRLVSVLEQPEYRPFTAPAEVREALRGIEDELAPAAQRLWAAPAAAAWLTPLWSALAQRAGQLPFEGAAAGCHAAALHLRAGDFAAVAAAVARIASWRRIPAPLAWMTEASFQLHGLDASWALLAELAWLAPERFDALTRRLADPLLKRLRKQFDAEFEGDGQEPDGAWFPAWVLCQKPALAALLGQAQPGLQRAPERAMRLLLDLLHLERQGRQHELVAQRKRLRDLQPALYAIYMQSR
ncbi:MAG TPA: hypothetical protein PKB14_01520 [Rubrivivax sp.]|nr:hypothetical protein [Rubrivivax sp.]